MKLTTVTKILELSPIPDADRIERAKVLGWDCVVQKGIHQVGDLVVFVFPDTLVPKKFLDSTYEGDEKVRLKTVKMKGQFSAGLILPLSVVLPLVESVGVIPTEDADFSAYLGIEKYEKNIPAALAGEVVGNFPTHLVNKTDEDNYRSNLGAIEEMKALGDAEVVLTVKVDGTSASYIFNEEFKVCSRNLELKEGSNAYWSIAKSHDIEWILGDVFEKKGLRLSIQGEIYGNGVQKNPLGLRGLDFAVFLISNTETRQWLSWDEIVAFCKEYGLATVKELGRFKASELDFSKIQEMADALKYDSGKNAEGIVVRPVIPVRSDVLSKSWLSLKVINQNYKD